MPQSWVQQGWARRHRRAHPYSLMSPPNLGLTPTTLTQLHSSQWVYKTPVTFNTHVLLSLINMQTVLWSLFQASPFLLAYLTQPQTRHALNRTPDFLPSFTPRLPHDSTWYLHPSSCSNLGVVLDSPLSHPLPLVHQQVLPVLSPSPLSPQAITS